MEKVWRPRPLDLAVVEALDRKGALTDGDLLKEMNETYGDISFRELNEVLMKMEIRGIIRVTKLMKGKRRVEHME